MTPEDFSWCLNERLLPYLPDLDQYVGRLPDQTKTAWAAQFRDIERADLVEACQRIADGYVFILRYDYEQLASKLLVMCREISEPRRRKAESQRTMDLAKRRGEKLGDAMADRLTEWGMGDAFREVMKRLDAGDHIDDVMSDIREKMGSSG